MIYYPSFNPDLSLIELDTSGGHIIRAIRAYRKTEAPRVGVHCSTIVNDIVKTMYPSKFKRQFLEQESLAYQEFGNIIEDVIANGCRRRWPEWTKPEPKVKNGIWCSPDGYDSSSRTIDEIKATWISEREFQDSLKLMTYTFQSLAYAYVWQAQRIRLHVFFVSAGYDRVPRPRSFILKWKPGVLEQNWRMLRQHGRDMKLLAA